MMVPFFLRIREGAAAGWAAHIAAHLLRCSLVGRLPLGR